jgi:hypothetical protein
LSQGVNCMSASRIVDALSIGARIGQIIANYSQELEICAIILL